MTEYLFAVQDATGREVVAWRGEAKVADVAAVRTGKTVAIEVAGEVARKGSAEPDAELQFLRWRADDKLARPVRGKVQTR